MTALLTIIAFQHIPAFFIVVATVGAVALCIFTGVVGERYHVAQKQINDWENPGTHLALERTAAFEKNFPEILKITTYPLGGLLPNEIQPHYRAYLSYVAQNMFKHECSTPDKQYEWLENFFKITPHPLDLKNLRDLFGHRFDAYGQAFIQLEALQLTLTNSRITPVNKALAKLKEEKYPGFEKFIPEFFKMVETHYQQEAVTLKASVLQDPSFVLKAYEAASTLLKKAHETVVESKQVAVVDIRALGSRPLTFPTISDNFCPAVAPTDADYAAFLAKVQKYAKLI
jgi:hypothetical protein